MAGGGDQGRRCESGRVGERQGTGRGRGWEGLRKGGDSGRKRPGTRGNHHTDRMEDPKRPLSSD